MKPLKIGIIGLGVVGGAVANNLTKNANLIAARAGREIKIVRAVAREAEKIAHLYNFPITENWQDLIKDEEVEAIIELAGGVEMPYELAKAALNSGRSLITANKAMLAYHREEIAALAQQNSLNIGFEASVGGGIPIIKALKEGLAANHIQEIRGIINGTCNYILTQMKERKIPYSTALSEAQDLGYAEREPSFDVDGFDSAHKLLILASIAFGLHARPEDILISGISEITEDELSFADEFGFNLKLLGIAKRIESSAKNEQIELRVCPTFVPKSALLGKVDGVMNAISLKGDLLGESLYYGAGAGGNATSSAVIADIIDLARAQIESKQIDSIKNEKTSAKPAMFGYCGDSATKLNLREKGEQQSAFYLRLLVKDQSGVLAQIAQVLGECGVSIASFLQKSDQNATLNTSNISQNSTKSQNLAQSPAQNTQNAAQNTQSQTPSAKLLFSTHTCRYCEIQNAISRLKDLPIILAKPTLLWIEK